MRLQPIMLPAGTAQDVVFPANARYLQLVQVSPDDAARVGLRFGHLPALMGYSDDGAPRYIDLAVGDRLPLPVTDDAEGPQALRCDALINYGVGLATRAVFAFGERKDGSDLWIPHQRWSDVQQHWELPYIAGADLPLNKPVDYTDKDWAQVPCKGFVSGVLDCIVTDETATGGVCICIKEVAANGATSYPVPLFILANSDGVADPKRSIPFVLSGTADSLLIRAWRFADAQATNVQIAGLRLFAKRVGASHVRCASSLVDMGAAGGARFVGGINTAQTSDMANTQHLDMRCVNDAASLTTIDFEARFYANEGMIDGQDNHRSLFTIASGALAAGATGVVTTSAGAAQVAMVRMVAAAAAQANGSFCMQWSG